MDLSTPEKLFSYIRTTPLERIIENAENAFAYEKNYQKYKRARLHRLSEDRMFVLYMWYRFFSANPLINYTLCRIFPKKFPAGYFDLRPFEYVFKNITPAPYSNHGTDGPPTFRDAIIELKENIEDYEFIYDRLSDELSKKTLYVILLARYTHDPSLFISERVYVSNREPCFDTTVYRLQSNAVYVDCGGYDGDTVLQFIKTFGRYKRIYVFEPDRLIVEALRHTLRMLKNIVIKNEGVSNKIGNYSFAQDGGGTGMVTTRDTMDTVQVPLTTLDAAVDESIDLIKMDIEGAEVEALEGAREHIATDAPILAINVYHKLDDIRMCLHEIERANPQYEFHLRHYCYIYIKTVLYANIKKT